MCKHNWHFVQLVYRKERVSLSLTYLTGITEINREAIKAIFICDECGRFKETLVNYDKNQSKKEQSTQEESKPVSDMSEFTT